MRKITLLSPTSIFAIILFGLMILLPTASNAEAPAKGKGAPTLNNTILKTMGYSGVSFSKNNDASWTLKNGITVYSSYPYGQKIRGFMGSTPLFIAVDKQRKVVAMAAAKNQETPEYFNLTTKLLKAWNGKTLQEAKKFTPDAVTGATLSSKAIIQTVQNTAKALTE